MSASVTTLLEAHSNGDESALNDLATLLYPELKSMARRRARSSAGSGYTANKRARDDVTLVDTIVGDDSHEKAEFLLQVDEMLEIVEQEDERLARVFECRYFAGLTTAETAEALDVSERSVERFWSGARSRIAELIDESSA